MSTHKIYDAYKRTEEGPLLKVMLKELKTCYNIFKEYESIHLAKGPEGEEKAKRNREHADRLKKLIEECEKWKN